MNLFLSRKSNMVDVSHNVQTFMNEKYKWWKWHTMKCNRNKADYYSLDNSFKYFEVIIQIASKYIKSIFTLFGKQ